MHKYDLIEEIIGKSRTLISRERLINVHDKCNLFNNTNLSFVECGVAKGGCLALMAAMSGVNNKVFGYDSFEGMPNIVEQDLDISYNKIPIEYVIGFNFSQGIESVFETFNTLNLNGQNVTIVKGFFQDIFLTNKYIDLMGDIAILRLDGDWYDSTKVCLDKLYDKVIVGGIIMIDDYGFWVGAKRATDKFREERKIDSPLIQTDQTEFYWIKKTM
jgi:hypothetical protein